MSQSIDKIALVIGAAGGVGGETCKALIRHGWSVRGLTRRPQPADTGIEWIAGDAMNAADVLRAAQGVRLIVHAANPPKRSARASSCPARCIITAPTRFPRCVRIRPSIRRPAKARSAWRWSGG